PVEVSQTNRQFLLQETAWPTCGRGSLSSRPIERSEPRSVLAPTTIQHELVWLDQRAFSDYVPNFEASYVSDQSSQCSRQSGVLASLPPGEKGKNVLRKKNKCSLFKEQSEGTLNSHPFHLGCVLRKGIWGRDRGVCSCSCQIDLVHHENEQRE